MQTPPLPSPMCGRLLVVHYSLSSATDSRVNVGAFRMIKSASG
jgi:hypothetical protein